MAKIPARGWRWYVNNSWKKLGTMWICVPRDKSPANCCEIRLWDAYGESNQSFILTDKITDDLINQLCAIRNYSSPVPTPPRANEEIGGALGF